MVCACSDSHSSWPSRDIYRPVPASDVPCARSRDCGEGGQFLLARHRRATSVVRFAQYSDEGLESSSITRRLCPIAYWVAPMPAEGVQSSRCKRQHQCCDARTCLRWCIFSDARICARTLARVPEHTRVPERWHVPVNARSACGHTSACPNTCVSARPNAGVVQTPGASLLIVVRIRSIHYLQTVVSLLSLGRASRS